MVQLIFGNNVQISSIIFNTIIEYLTFSLRVKVAIQSGQLEIVEVKAKVLIGNFQATKDFRSFRSSVIS